MLDSDPVRALLVPANAAETSGKITDPAAMAGMEQLEIHSKASQLSIPRHTPFLTGLIVLPGALGECEVRAYYLMEYTTTQEIYQLRYLQAPGLGYRPYTEATHFDLRSTPYSRCSTCGRRA